MEGYLLLALHDPRYLDLAANFAISVKRLEPRPVSVVISPETPVPEAYTRFFDQIIRLEDHPNLRGAMAKTLLFGASPYERTMYIDADCLLFNTKIEFFWRQYRGHPFAVEGRPQKTGPVFACSLGVKDAAVLCQLVNVPELTVFNAGVMYFENSAASERVFNTAIELFEGPHRDEISYPYKHDAEYADEPFFACALAMLGIAPFRPTTTHRLQVTTPNMIEGVMDLTVGDLQVIKQVAGGRTETWAGAIGHFCGLAPMDTYFGLADQLRDEAGLERMDRSQFQAKVMTANTHHD
ncbi:MAG: hypothetical protein RIC29_08750 [Rhodospirillaceae bacterium]